MASAHEGRASYPHLPSFPNAFGSALPMGWERANGGPPPELPGVGAERKSVAFDIAGRSRIGQVEQQSTGVQSEDMRLQQLQSLLDFALKQKLEEDSLDATKIRQLEEIVLMKDRANKDLRANLESVEEALADANISVEHKHLQLINERIAHEQTQIQLKDLQQQFEESQRTIETLKEELKRSAEQLETGNKRVSAARKDALDRLHEEDEAKRALAAVQTKYTAHRQHSRTVQANLGEQLYRSRERLWKRLCFHEWNLRLEMRGHKRKTVKALEAQSTMRRLLLWRAQNGRKKLDEEGLAKEQELKTVKDQVEALEASKAEVAMELRVMEAALDRSQEEEMEAAVGALEEEVSRISQLETQLDAARFDLRVMSEELQLSNEMVRSVKIDQEAQEAARKMEEEEAEERGREAAEEEERTRDREEALAELGHGCRELGLGGEEEEGGWRAQAEALVELGRRERAARRDREWMVEERQTLKRQLQDVERQLAVAEEENRLLRGLQIPLVSRGALGLDADESGAGAGAGAGGVGGGGGQEEDGRDEAIVMLSEELGRMQERVELLAADLQGAMGRLSVTVLAGKGLGGGRGSGEYMVRVRVEGQEAWTQGKRGGAPAWEEELQFAVRACSRHVDVQLVEKGGGSVGAGRLALADADLGERSSAVWLAMQGPADKEGASARAEEEEQARVQLVLVYRGPEVAYPRGALLDAQRD